MHYCGVYFHHAMKPPLLKKRKQKGLSQSETSMTPSPEGSVTSLSSDDKSLDTTLDSNDGAGDAQMSDYSSEQQDAVGMSKVNSKSTKSSKSDGNTKVKNGGDRKEENKVEMKEKQNESKNAKESMKENGVLGDTDTKESTNESKEKSEEKSNDKDNERGEDNDKRESKEKCKEKDKIVEEEKYTYFLPSPARRVRLFVLFLAISNLVPLLYFSLIHQRGTVSVMNFIHEASLGKVSSMNIKGSPKPTAASMDVMFLMPCHSTPYYSYLHSNISMRFLTCEPNLNHTANYTDEADVFYQSPSLWLKNEYQQGGKKLPSHVVFFNVLIDKITDFLTQGGYSKCANIFHTHLPEGRIGSHVVVACR